MKNPFPVGVCMVRAQVRSETESGLLRAQASGYVTFSLYLINWEPGCD